MNKGKNNPPKIQDMLSDELDAKEKGLAISQGKSLYKKESGEYQADELRKLVSLNLEAIPDIPTNRISLSDIDEIKRRTVIYLKVCERAGTFPSSRGFAKSIGYSERELRYWRSRKPDTPTGRWLEIFSDICSDILTQSALKNNANPVVSIFTNKALYDMRETNELILTPNNLQEEIKPSVEDIRKRYLMDEYEEEE